MGQVTASQKQRDGSFGTSREGGVRKGLKGTSSHPPHDPQAPGLGQQGFTLRGITVSVVPFLQKSLLTLSPTLRVAH